jgi:Protein of unknown function (DUF2381)
LLRPFIPCFALAFLLVGLTAAAQSGQSRRSIVLTGKAGESPLIYLAGGQTTVILLDAKIVRESVKLQGPSFFKLADVGDAMIVLTPWVPFPPKTRLSLEFTYREGTPRTVELLLTEEPGQVDLAVEVSRPKQPEKQKKENAQPQH